MRRTIMTLSTLGALALLVVAAPATADRKGRQVRYLGIHPVPKAEGGGICYIEGPHVHIFAADKIQYRDHQGSNYFVGDPVAYGYDGPKVSYKGNHPIHVDVVVGDADPDVEYCYIDGPHFHYFAPPEGPEFKVVGDAYFYVEAPPPVYVEARPTYLKINAMYAPLVYDRPVITVDAPVGWIGARVEFLTPAVVVAPVVVVPPRVGVEVHVPMPSISIGIGIGGSIGGGTVIRGGGHGKHKGRGHWK